MSVPGNSGGQPDDAATRHESEGLRLASLGKLTEALNHFQAAIRLRPDDPIFQFNHGLVWQHLRQLPNAIAAYQSAVRLKPDFYDAWNNLSAALKGTGDLAGSIAAGQEAVRINPNASGAHLNLGNALKAAGDWAGAESSYRRGLILDPNNPKIRLNLGNTLREAGRLPEAIAALRQAVERSPDFPEAHRDLAFTLLLSGHLAEGWIENEWRWQTEDMARKRRTFAAPAWQGEDLAGRRVLVYTEQGFGDAIQFVRYVKLLSRRGGQVIVECQLALKRLFEALDGVSELVVRGETMPAFDFHAPLLSLPRMFGTTLQNIPSDVPYLAAPSGLAAELPPLTGTGLKAGLVWAGNPDHINDRNRSMSLPLLRPLLSLEGIRFFSLQVGERSAELRRTDGFEEIPDLSPSLRDFAATAAAISQLDLVISVDTVVCHLAGALGKRVWLLLPFAPDWRWLLGRDDCPWYPSMRLFRQAKAGDWTGAVDQLGFELRKLAGSNVDPEG